MGGKRTIRLTTQLLPISLMQALMILTANLKIYSGMNRTQFPRDPAMPIMVAIPVPMTAVLIPLPAVLHAVLVRLELFAWKIQAFLYELIDRA